MAGDTESWYPRVVEIAFAVTLYALPLLLVPLLKLRPRHVVLVALLASFVGDGTYWLCVGDRYLSALVGFYPVAVIPLGLWAGVIGGAGIRALEKMTRFAPRVPLAFLGALGGALVGAAFMALYWLGVTVALRDSAAITPPSFALLVHGAFARGVPFVFAGLAAGTASGVLCSHFAVAGRLAP